VTLLNLRYLHPHFIERLTRPTLNAKHQTIHVAAGREFLLETYVRPSAPP